jgi:hypothetical protein
MTARIVEPLLSHTLFPIYCAVALWAGLGMRERRLREFVSLGS